MVKPLVKTQYRAIAQDSPPVRSAPRLVLVRSLVDLRLSDSTPRRGSLMRFSGSVYPAHDGLRVFIQKRSPSGRFVTGRAPDAARRGQHVLHVHAAPADLRDGVYRAKLPSDGDHVNGFSRTRSVTVH